MRIRLVKFQDKLKEDLKNNQDHNQDETYDSACFNHEKMYNPKIY